MNNQIIKQLLRFLLVFIIQVILLKRLDLTLGSFNYIHIFLYPILILFLPFKTPRAVLLILAFFLGLGLDLFYNSVGIHASATVFLAFIRKYILKLLEPVEGYNFDKNISVTAIGLPWLLSYVAILLFAHNFWFFSVEAFSFVYLKEILLRTFSTFIASYILIMLYLLIFNPKN